VASSVAKSDVLSDYRHDHAIWDVAGGLITTEISCWPVDLAVLHYPSGTTGVSNVAAGSGQRPCAHTGVPTIAGLDNPTPSNKCLLIDDK
jgi:hypothetical protein